MLLSLNPGPCKTWLIACERSGQAMLVDPIVDQVEVYAAKLAAHKLTLVRVLDTHTHADHLSASTLLARRFGAAYAMSSSSSVQTITERLKDGDSVAVGALSYRVLHTPGHTKDSLSLVGAEELFTGDFLFLGEGGAGRTDLLGGDPGEHWDSLQRLKSLGDHLRVLPGHDYRGNEQGRLGEERTKNPRLAPRSREQYVRWLASLHLDPAEWMLEVLRANAEGRTDKRGLNIPSEGACCEVRGGESAIQATNVDCQTLAARLGSKSSAPYFVLDVREVHEFVGELGRVPNSRNISVQQLEGRLAELEDVRERELFVICRSGVRSLRAVDILQRAGFPRPINVAGGMLAWAAAGLPQEFEAKRS